MVGKLFGRDERDPGARARRGRTSALNAPRRRVHALAPEHVGELGSIAALTVAVLGLATVIFGVALVVMGLTLSGRYVNSGSVPPNLGQLATLPIWGGVGVTVLGVVLLAAPVALLADVRFARVATVAVALIAAAISLTGFGVMFNTSPIDPVIVVALGVVALLLAVSALLLARPGR